MAKPKPKQAKLDSFFSPRGQDVQPSTTSIRPMPTEETPITPTVSTDTYIHGQQQTYEMGITNDLRFGLNTIHSLQMLRDTDF